MTPTVVRQAPSLSNKLQQTQPLPQSTQRSLRGSSPSVVFPSVTSVISVVDPVFTRSAMPFYRFEGLKSHRFNPHLSTAEGPVIEGEYLYFRMVTKRAGTGAELHYHPNELMMFPLTG